MTGEFPRLDILPESQRRLWPRLAAIRDSGFVLYGGTAVALRLGHRQSVDFDFFSHREFRPEMLIREFRLLADAPIVQESPNTLTVLVPGEQGPVKISFFGGLTFGRLDEPQTTPDEVMVVASMLDLLAHKLKVILQRVESKDYLDIDALLRTGTTLAEGLAGAQALYPNFPVQEALKALTYFKGGDLEALSRDVREHLIRQSRQVLSVPRRTTVSPRLAG